MKLQVESRAGICELHLADPPGNILDGELCEALAEAVRSHAGDPHLKAFLLSAEGKHFSYGASVPEHEAGKVEGFLPRFQAVFKALAASRVPVLAAVSGRCLGGAFELVAFSHFVIADETAVFAVPEIRLGVIPPLACLLLPWRLGGALAEDLVLSGRDLGAAEAARAGLVTRLCAAGELQTEVERFCDETLRARSAAALRLAVEAVRKPWADDLQARIDALERLYLEGVMGTRDAHEGIRAFLEKRQPVWSDA